ncbi:MAG: hypothetical protein ONB30_05160 [candidate division KSB1 bacterium]|nr:hypothetical protein [candidate division KSB1 bacterium]
MAPRAADFVDAHHPGTGFFPHANPGATLRVTVPYTASKETRKNPATVRMRSILEQLAEAAING